jgi:hypothetical protein
LSFLKYLSSLGAINDFTKVSNSKTYDKSDGSGLIKVHSNTLIYYPRLFMTLLSLIVDICLLFISELCNLDESSVLITFSTSYIAFVYLTRTFSNSIETFLFSILMYLILKSIKSQYVLNEKFILDKKDTKKNVSTPKRYRLFDIYKFNYLGSIIGLIVCIGIFNRPTFIIYAFVPLAYWLFYGLDNCNLLSQMITYFIRRAISLCKLALPASILFVLIDTIYYHDIKNINQLKHVIFNHNKLVITPYNFFQYNSKSENVKQHGEHPFYQHFLVNCFLLFGFNHLILIFVFIQFLIQFYVFISKINSSNSNTTTTTTNTNNNNNNNFQSISNVKKLKNYISKIYTLFINNTLCFLLFSFLFPILIFSLVKHQEPRFLLPLIIPLCLITSHCVFGDRSYSLFKFLWIIFNILGVIIYGYIHQGGMVSAMSHIQKTFTHISNLEIDQHVIFYQTYMPPRYLVMAPVAANLINNKRYIYEFKKRIENGEDEFDFDRKTNKKEKLKNILPPNRFIYDLMASSNYKSLENLFDELQKNYTKLNKNYAIFLVTPSVAEVYLRQNLNKKFNFELLTEFKFHFSFEHLSEYHEYLKCQFKFLPNTEINKAYINSCKKKSGLKKLIDCLNLNLYQIA